MQVKCSARVLRQQGKTVDVDAARSERIQQNYALAAVGEGQRAAGEVIEHNLVIGDKEPRILPLAEVDLVDLDGTAEI